VNISIIGPEGSGKTSLAIQYAKRAAFGRPVFIMGELKTQYQSMSPEQFRTQKNCVSIIDDANAFLDSFELARAESPYRKPVIMSRHWNRVNIFVFHSIDDAIKFMFRQSRYIIISKRYRDTSTKDNKFIKGIKPVEIGRAPYLFLSYKRY
jgi:hypothetical protein